MSLRFQRQQEDFVCGHCQTKVMGDGYTNHCPACLWSKHVDIYPGDRAEACGGMMRPWGYEALKTGHRILQKCERCGLIRPNKVVSEDDRGVLAIVAREAAERVLRGES
jgi:hypothetical protein